jgi:hypothetical protein
MNLVYFSSMRSVAENADNAELLDNLRNKRLEYSLEQVICTKNDLVAGLLDGC